MSDRRLERVPVQAGLAGLVLAAAVAFALWLNRDEAGAAPAGAAGEPPAPLVRVAAARAASQPPPLDSHGTLRAADEIELVARVPGEVVTIADAFTAGGRFEAGERLLAVDDAEHQLARREAAARLARARQQLIIEREKAAQTRADWEILGESGKPGPLALRQPQIADARASRRRRWPWSAPSATWHAPRCGRPSPGECARAASAAARSWPPATSSGASSRPSAWSCA